MSVYITSNWYGIREVLIYAACGYETAHNFDLKNGIVKTSAILVCKEERFQM